jgi:hypothetical protein
MQLTDRSKQTALRREFWTRAAKRAQALRRERNILPGSRTFTDPDLNAGSDTMTVYGRNKIVLGVTRLSRGAAR